MFAFNKSVIIKYLMYASLMAVAILPTAGLLLSAGSDQDRSAATNTAVGGAALTAQSAGCSANLKDGSVLITGGHGASGTSNGAQVFSARKGALPVGPMLSAREGHACAALPDGRVLVAGGTTNGGGVTNSAEIFDPGTGRWTAAGAMAAARSGAAGVNVAGGRILIAGGASNGAPTSSLEVFEPATNSFRALPALLTSPRMQHATVALPNGKVLIVGGSNGAASLDSIDVFDPTTNTVTSLGKKLSSPRAGLSATVLLDGRVFFTGGNDGKQDLNSADIYNPKTGAMIPAAPMSAARSGHLAILVPNNNTVLIVGGNAHGGLVQAQEIYVPWQNSYRPLGQPGNSGRSAEHAVAASATQAFAQAAAQAADGTPAAAGDTPVLPTLYTDKPDYSPGQTANITGAGWTPNTDVTFLLSRDPQTLTDTTWTATADADGNITTTYDVVEADLGVTFTLTATSGAGDTAQIQTVVFTDAGNISGVTVGLQSPSSIAPGSPATYAVTVAVGGNPSSTCTATLAITTTLPTGGTYAFIPPSVSSPSNNPSLPSTLTISTTAATPPGLTGFTVRAVGSGGCGNTVTNTGTLSVSGAPVITSANNTTFAVGVLGSFTVLATGTPAPTFAESGTLPSGVSFSTSTHVLSGTPAAGTAGTYPITFTASNGVLPNATQNFTLTVANPPTVTINQAAAQADPTNTSPINFTVVFSTSVTGFSSSGVAISGTAGGTKTVTVTGSGATYNVAVSGMTAGTVTAAVNANAAQDAASLGNTASTFTDNTVTYDTTAPITASVTTPAIGSAFRAVTVPATFGGSAADNSGGSGLNANSTTFTLQRGSDSFYWTGSTWQSGVSDLATTHSATASNTAAPWTSNVTMPTWASESDGAYTAQTKATDKAGNTFTGTAVSFALDKTAPTTASVTAPVDGSVYGAATVPASFSGSVADNSSGSGLAANSTTFTLQRGSDNNYWNGSAWQVAVFNLSSTHSVTTSAASATWTDSATLPTWSSQINTTYLVQATATDKAGNTFTGGAVSFTLDTVAPTISSVTPPANGSYRATQTLDFTVNFSENVTVTGAPTIGLTIGATGRNAGYLSGSGTSALLFRYTIVNGDNDSNGIASTSPMALNTGTIKDTVGNNATLTFTPPNTAGVLVDTAGPTAAITYSPAGAVKQGTSLTITATFNEAMADSPVVQIAISGVTGGSALPATNMTKVTSTQYTYPYTVQAGNGNANVTLSVGTDLVGNVVTSTPTNGAFTVDNIAPVAPSLAMTAATDAGSSSTDRITNVTTPAFTGTAGAGSATVTIFSDGVQVGIGTAAAFTSPGITVSTLSAGTHSITATATDAAGNISPASAALSVTIDTTAPAAPSTLVTTTNPTTDTTPTFTGTADANSTVIIYSDGVQVATGTAAAYTSSGLTATTLGPGTRSITATATDVAGNVSSTSAALSLVVLSGINQTATAIGTASDSSSGATLSVSAVNVAVGKTIFVTVAADDSTDTITVSDTGSGGSNAYTQDANVNNVNGVRTLVFSAPVIHALSAGTITVNFAATAPFNKAATFFSFDGILSASPKDQSHTATGNSELPNSGATAITIQPNELLIGAAGHNERTASFTAGSGFTLLTASGTGGQSQGNGVVMQPEFRVVTATGAYAADESTGSNKAAPWAAAIVTYKIVVPTASIVRADASPTSASSVHFTVTFSEPVVGVDTTDFSLTLGGGATGSIADVTGSGTTYTVTVSISSSGSGSGAIGLNLVDNDSIVDNYNIPLGGTGTGGILTGPVYDLKTATTTAVSSSNNPSNVGDAVTFTATVTKTGGSSTPVGAVTFLDVATTIGTGTLNGGGPNIATFSTSSLTAGPHSITARYEGDTIFSSSTSPAIVQTVNTAATTSLTVATATATYGGTTTLSATLKKTSDNTSVSGKTISFTLNGGSAVTATTDASGIATLSNVSLAGINAGPYATGVAAVFAGDTGFATSNGNNSLTVSQAPVTASVTASDKIYDGSNSATITSCTLTGVLAADAVNVSCAATSATFSSVNAGTWPVTATGISLSGTKSGNYTLSSATATATAKIDPKPVTASVTASDKTYDGNDSATITNCALTGVLAADAANVSCAATSATFSSVNAGTWPVTATGISLSGIASGNYTPSSATATTSAKINPKPVTGSFTASNKVYDATTAATIATRSLSGVVGSDSVSLTGGTATFSDKNVGNVKTVTGNGFGLTGTDAGNYTLASTTLTATANITAATVTGSFTASDKVYDATTTAAIATRSLSGVLGGDSVSVTGGTATFSDKNVGIGKTVNGAGFSLTGTDAGNYTLASTTLSTTANITARTLNVSATGVNKVYDGTAAATVTLSDNRVAGDAVTDSHTSASFVDKNAAPGKTVNVSGISISGTDAGNYALANATATTTANIAQQPASVTPNASSKTFGAADPALTGILSGFIALDSVTATYNRAAGENVGAYTIGATLSPSDVLSNYNITSNTAVVFTISQATTITTLAASKTSALPADPIVLTATVTSTGPRTGFVQFSSDATALGLPVALSGGVATITLAPGTLAINHPSTHPSYALTAVYSGDPNNIGGASLAVAETIYNTPTGANVAVSPYDFSAHATVTADTITFDNATSIGTTSIVPTATTDPSFPLLPARYHQGTPSSGAPQFFTLATTAAFPPSVPGSIKACLSYAGVTFSHPLTITLLEYNSGTTQWEPTSAQTIDSADKIACGKVEALGSSIIVEDTATTTTLSSSRPSGSTYGDSVTFTAAITPSSATGVVVFKDGEAIICSAVTVTSGQATCSTSTLTVAGSPHSITANFSDPTTYFASSSGNFSQIVGKRTVTPNITASNKVYDANTTATIATRTLTGVVGTDDVTLTGGTATFADKNAGTTKTVNATGLSLNGTAAGNYELSSTSATATADITAKALIVSATGINKVYDGTASATVTLSDNHISGDVLSASYSSAAFNNKNVATGKTVTVSGISISGADAGNYLPNTSASTTADITARPLTVTATGVDKVYDGNTTATVTLSDNKVTGDTVTDSYTAATFADKNIGAGKVVSVSGISLSGADSGNYTLSNTTASTTANITALAITGSITANNKTYDGNSGATIAGRTLTGAILGDAVTYTGGTATFVDKNVANGKTVTATGLGLSGADAGNYTVNETATTTANITALAITGSITAANKVYDQTTAASMTGRTLSGVLIGDTVSYVGGTAAFADKNAGSPKTVTATGLSLTGADAGNYTVNGTATTTASIAPRSLTVTATGVNKTYDATTAATVTLSDDRIAGDLLTHSFTGATFADKNVGTGKPVNVSGISISGTDSGNYALANATAATTANITQQPASVTPNASSKTFGAADPALTGTLSGFLALDSVTAAYSRTAGENVGAYTIGATLSPSGVLSNYNITYNTAVVFTISQATTITTLAASKTSALPADSIDLTATVTSTGPTTGSVQFFSDTTLLATVPLSGGVATKTLAPGTLAINHPGTHPSYALTAVYSGDLNNIGGASLSVAETIYNTATGANVAVSPYDFSAHATVTADTITFDNVTGIGTTSIVPTATTDSSFPALPARYHQGTPSSGAPQFFTLATTAAFPPSVPGSIKACLSYAGVTFTHPPTITLLQYNSVTPAWEPTSAQTIDSVNKIACGKVEALGSFIIVEDTATTTTLSSSRSSGSTYGDSVTFTAAITPSSATGVVDFKDGAATICSAVTVTSGQATCSTSTLTVAGSTHSITANFSDPTAYFASSSGNFSQIVGKRTVTPNITVSNKVYDANTAATIATRTLTGVVGTDDVTLTGGTATFADKNAGTTKTVTATGLSLTGAAAGNYELSPTSATATADITAKTLTVSATGINKVYDGNTSATVTLSDNHISGDALSASYSSAAFNNKNVGTGKTVTVSSISISGTDSGNYTANASAGTTADITARPLTVTATGVDKVYDGNTTATVTLSDNKVTGDTVTDSYTGATFADKNVGAGKVVSVSGISLSGADSANYTLSNTTASTTANITARSLTVSAAGQNKVYDGNPTATVTLSDNRVVGDTLTTSHSSATFDNKNVGIGKAVSVSGISIAGTDSGNYTFNTTASATADITARPLTVNAAGANKVYDGTAAATVTLSDNRVSGDVVTDSYTSASFFDKNVGTGRTVSVSGISISGTDAGNYTVNSTATTTADITKATLTVSAAGVNKVYDGNLAATVTLTDNRIAGDVLTDSFASASFADKNAAPGKIVSVSGISISGTDAGNYAFNTTASTTAGITALAITGSITASNRVYDATTAATIASRTLSGVLGTDLVSYSGGTASFDNKNVGTGKTVTALGLSLSGGDAGNYTVNTTATATANITALAITGSITAVSKVYDQTTAASITNRTLTGVLSGDTASYAGGTAAFSDKNVGTGKTVTATGLSLNGTDAGNYTVNSTAATTADITKATLTVSAAGVNKGYDGNTTATVTLTDNRIGGDVLTGSFASASFADKNVGASKPVSVNGISISGVDAVNYQFNTTAPTTASITALAITGSITASNKVYDATTVATIASRTLSGVLGTDLVSYSGGTATFAYKNVGPGKTVTATGLSLSGGDAGNYTVNPTATATADITALAITGSITASGKVYDGTSAANITIRTLTGVLSGDTASYAGGTAAFSDKNVGNGKTVTATGLSLSGTDAGNYTVNATAATTADITQATLTVSAAGVNKVYDGNLTAAVTLSDNRIAGDVLTDSFASANFADKNAAPGKPVNVSGISISGTDAGNYAFNPTASTTASITPLAITGSITASNNVYDTTTAATITSRTLTGVLGSDAVNYVGGTATFASKNVGTGKTVTAMGLSLTGLNAGNYTVNTTATVLANITALTIAGSITADSRVYDGTSAATIATRTLTGVLSGDTVSYIGGTATFSNKNVGTGKTVTATGLSLSGTDAGNYAANTTTSTTASITARGLTITATGVNRVYDGTIVATVTLSDNRVSGDVLTDTYASASFANPAVGSGITVTVNGISIPGTDAGNYTFNTTASTTANITTRNTLTSLTSSLDPSVTPVRVSLTATVASGGTAPVGTVTFTDGTANIPGTVNLSVISGNLVATLSTTSLGVGPHVITATYNPASANFTGSSSAFNAAPTAAITSPAVGALNPAGTAFNFTGTFSDPTGGATPTTAAWTFDTVSLAGVVAESAGSGTVTKSYAFSAGGVYYVSLTVNDNVGGISIVNTISGLNALIVVYDPNAGFVTGGGWINSPAGAYTASPSLAGKASFGFVSKYQKGANVPTGETEFNFQVANFNFHSATYQWLVVSGPLAQYKGTGTINGSGTYNFLLTALEGDAPGGGGTDGFRIKITDPNTSAVIYDNLIKTDDTVSAQNTQALGGGSIVIHSK